MNKAQLVIFSRRILPGGCQVRAGIFPFSLASRGSSLLTLALFFPATSAVHIRLSFLLALPTIKMVMLSRFALATASLFAYSGVASAILEIISPNATAWWGE